MAVKKLYKCYMPSMNYITAKGRTCSFIEGRFLTDHPDEIKEIDQMVSDKSNPHIYIDENETEVDTTLQEKIKAAQREVTLQILAEEAARKQVSEPGGKEEDKSEKKEPEGDKGVGSTMSPASLLNVTSSAGLAALSSMSNSK